MGLKAPGFATLRVDLIKKVENERTQEWQAEINHLRDL
jgi:hypothetical protein